MSANNVVFRDVVLLCLGGLLVALVILIYHIRPPADEEEVAAPGSLIVEAVWAPDLDCDIDLWLQAGDRRAVGYSRKSGHVWDLLRDDLGNRNEPEGLGINIEHAYTRGLPAGEYVINLHAYRCGPYPQRVRVMVSRRIGHSAPALLDEVFTLSRHGEELTVARYTVDENQIVRHAGNAYKQLRSRP